MREILYRGKRNDNGEWVEGYYLKTQISGIDVHCIVPFGALCKIFPDKVYQVDPDTVGEYTGRKGKGEKRIFEHDIVDVEIFGHHYTAKIVFNEKTCGIELWYPVTVRGTFAEKLTSKVNLSPSPYVEFSEIEVIGNIHDNPEMLE